MTPFSSPASSSSPCNGRTTAGCISRILRRILCFSNLPLRSFHHFNKDDQIVVESCGSTPGLVARLMGLESLPIEETAIISSSIYEKSRFPPYKELQDDNFFILSFERRKSGRNSKRQKQGRRRRTRNRDCAHGKNKEEATDFSEEVLEFEIRGGKAGNVIRPIIRAKKVNEVELGYEAEGDSENSSPNSVLEFVGFAADQESASSEDVSRLANSKLRRPLSDELENCGEKKVMKNLENDYAGTWEEMGELAGMEMMKWSWLEQEMSKNGDCLMEIGRDLELMILDQLLNEMLINLQVF